MPKDIQQSQQEKLKTSTHDDHTHPIATAIDKYMHSVRDIKFTSRTFIPLATEFESKNRAHTKETLEKANTLIKTNDTGNRAHAIKLILQANRNATRQKFSNITNILEQSLFLSLFSAFDAFTGDLLRAIYMRKPELFDSLSKPIPLKEVLNASSIDSLKSTVLDSEIESFRRKSYSDQFETLENLFKISLKKFDKWPHFIEASQRRNLLTHCGGIVSEQYREVCRREGVPTAQIAQTGESLYLGADYMLSSCELMLEVGLKLGQTLWRKLFAEELADADEHLHGVVYDALLVEQWNRAETFGIFFLSQPKFSSDLKRRMAVINLAIALQHLKKEAELKKILNDHDWSASLPEFHLAEAVLCSKYEEASRIMVEIGKRGQILTQEAYHTWPLFNKFRDKSAFLETYEKIFNHPFITKAQESTAKIVNELADDGKKRAVSIGGSNTRSDPDSHTTSPHKDLS